MKPGNCSQKISKWFYDKKLRYCRQFDFTGCNGNQNRLIFSYNLKIYKYNY